MIPNIKKSDTEIYFLFFSLFLLIFGYFYWFGNYVLFFQEKQSLFIFSGEYFHEFINKPGGLLKLLGNFLTQFYFDPILGIFILATIIILPSFILLNINKQLLKRREFLLVLMVLPTCFLLLMQSHYFHLMEYNLGFLMVLLYFLFSILPREKHTRFIILSLYPLFYYVSGAFAWIFLGMFIIYSLSYETGQLRFFYPVIIVLIAAVSLIAFKFFLFLEPYSQLFKFPFPTVVDPKHKLFLILITGYVLLYPLLVKANISVRINKLKTKFFSLVASLFVFLITAIILIKLYSPQTAKVAKIEKFVFEKKYDEAIEYHEKYPLKNLIGQYFYNIALSETNQLCDRLFFGTQNFGSNALLLRWDSELTHVERGAYFFYSIGLINEAHRWAYVDMVVNGFRPQNIKLLVKTNLINGNYRMAEKYISLLKKTLYYKKCAKRYETLLYEPTNIQSNPEMGEKIKLLPKENFFIHTENPQNNISLILQATPDNKNAFEYKMAWLLLEKNVEEVVNEIKKMKSLGYTRIPKHIEEAVLAFANSRGELPNLGGLMISRETRQRFGHYVSEYKKNQQTPSLGKEAMQKSFGDTFWFYFHFI